MLPKVLVGCPTSSHKEYCLKQYVKAVRSLTYSNYDILLVDNTKDDYYINKIKELKIPVIKGPYFENARDRIVSSRNILRREVLNKNYDYLLSLEQDIIPPPDIIQRLLTHGKKIISGVYFSYQTNNNITLLVPLLWKRVAKDEVRFMLEEEIIEPQLIEVGACGLGCILISKDILKKVKFRFNKKDKGFDDMWFCYDSFKKSFRIFADTSVKCKHLIKNWSWDGIKK
jgi:GT2 family glycosyltransferase